MKIQFTEFDRVSKHNPLPNNTMVLIKYKTEQGYDFGVAYVELVMKTQILCGVQADVTDITHFMEIIEGDD